MLPTYKLAHLTPEQFAALERLENDIHVTLVAYEPAGSAGRDDMEIGDLATDDTAMDALVDTYRTYDPDII